MPFWKCYYHLIWATKDRTAIITADNEAFLFATIRHIASELNSDIFAINGTHDHIHVAAAIPPNIAIAAWVKRCKGASSHTLNQTFTNQDRFHWEIGYGVLTYGYKQLEFVIDYIKNQKAHHAEGTVQAYLEQIDSD